MSKLKYYKKIYNNTITLPIIPSEGIDSNDTSYYALLEKNYTPIVSQEACSNKPDWIEGITLTTNDTYYNKLALTKVKAYDSSTYVRFAKLEFYVTSPDITSDASAIEPCNKIYANVIQAPKEDVNVYVDIIPYTKYDQIYDLNTKQTILTGDKQLLKVVYYVRYNGNNIYKDNIIYNCDNDILNNNIVSSTINNGRCEVIYNIDENISGKDIVSNITVSYKTKYAEFSDSVTVTLKYNTYIKRLGIETFNITSTQHMFNKFSVNLVCEVKKNNTLVDINSIKLLTNYNSASNLIRYTINDITETTIEDNRNEVSIYNINITVEENLSNVKRSIVLYVLSGNIITNEVELIQDSNMLTIYVSDNVNSSTCISNPATYTVSGDGSYYTINYYVMTSDNKQIVLYTNTEYNTTGLSDKTYTVTYIKDDDSLYDIVSDKIIDGDTSTPYKQLKIYIPDNTIEDELTYLINFGIYKSVFNQVFIILKPKEYTTKVDTNKSTTVIGGLKEYSKINIYCYGLIGTTHYINKNNVKVEFTQNEDLIDLDSVTYTDADDYLIITYSLKDDFGIDRNTNKGWNETREIVYTVTYGSNGIKSDEVTVEQWPVFFGVDYDKYCNDSDDNQILTTISGILQTHTLKTWGIIYNYYKDVDNKRYVPLESINDTSIVTGSGNIFVDINLYLKSNTYSTVKLNIEQNDTGVTRELLIRLNYKVSWLTNVILLNSFKKLPSEYVNNFSLKIVQSSVLLSVHLAITINGILYDESETSITINPFVTNNIKLFGYVTDPDGEQVKLSNFNDNNILYSISDTDHIVYSITPVLINETECTRNIIIEPTYYYTSLTLSFRHDCIIDNTNVLSSDTITLTKDFVYTGDKNNNIILDNNTYMYNVSTSQTVSANETPASIYPYVKYFSPDTRNTLIDVDTTHYNVSIYQKLLRIINSELSDDSNDIISGVTTNSSNSISTRVSSSTINSSFTVGGNTWVLPGGNTGIDISLPGVIDLNNYWVEIVNNDSSYLKYNKSKSNTDSVEISFLKNFYGNDTPYTLNYKIIVNYKNYREKTDSSNNTIVVYNRTVSKTHFINIEPGTLLLDGHIYTIKNTSYGLLGTYTNDVSTYVSYMLNNMYPDTYKDDISIYSSTLTNIRYSKFDNITNNNLIYPNYIFYVKPDLYVGLSDKVHTINISSKTFTDLECTLTYIQYGLSNSETNVVLTVNADPYTIDATGGTTTITATVTINGKTLKELNIKPTIFLFLFSSVKDASGVNISLNMSTINDNSQLVGTYTFSENKTSISKQINVTALYKVTENLLTKSWYGSTTVTLSTASIELYCIVSLNEIPAAGGTFTVTYYAIVNGLISSDVTLYVSTIYSNFVLTSDVISDNKHIRTYTVSANDSTELKSVTFYSLYNELVSDLQPTVILKGSVIDVNITSSIDDKGRKIDGLSKETVKLTYYGLLNNVNVTDLSKVKLVLTSPDSPKVNIKNTTIDSTNNVITSDAIFPVNNTTSLITYTFTVTYSSNENNSVSKTILFTLSVGEFQVLVETSRVVILDSNGANKYKYDPGDPDITPDTVGTDTYNWDETTLTIYVYVIPKVEGIDTNDNSNYIDIKDILYLSMDSTGTESGMSPLKNLTLVSKLYDLSTRVSSFVYSFGKNEGVGGNLFKVSKFTVTYNSKSGTATARLLGKDLRVLAPFDYLVFDYELINGDATHYFEPAYLGDYTGYTLDNLNKLAGRDMDTITDIYANDNINLPYYMSDTSTTIYLNKITMGFALTVSLFTDYNDYNEIIRFSGDNIQSAGHEFVAINFKKILENQDLISLGINTIYSDLYAHWYNFRGTGKIKITYTTYSENSSDYSDSFQDISILDDTTKQIGIPDTIHEVDSVTIDDCIAYDESRSSYSTKTYTKCATLTYILGSNNGTITKNNVPGNAAVCTAYFNDISIYKNNKYSKKYSSTTAYKEVSNTMNMLDDTISKKYSDTITFDFSNSIYKLCYQSYYSNNYVLTNFNYITDLRIYNNGGSISSFSNKKLTVNGISAWSNNTSIYNIVLLSPTFYEYSNLMFQLTIKNTST